MNIEKIRQQAQDRNTPPEILEQLINSGDKLTCKYVASNPISSIKILNKLCKEFPDEVFNNPQVDKIIADKSQKIPINLIIAREKYWGTIKEVFDLGTGCEDAEVWAQALKTNLNPPNKQPQSLGDEQKLSPQSILKLAQDPDETVRINLLESNNKLIDLVPEILWQLAHDQSEVVRANVAYYQKLSPKLISIFSCDRSLMVRCALVEDRNYHHNRFGANSHLPIAILWQMLGQSEADPDLATSPPLIFRKGEYFETRNYELSARLINFYIKKAIVKHPETPLDFLMTLIKDEDEEIRATAASNSKLSANVLEQLLNDNSSKVKWAVLDNPSTDSDTLRLYLAKGREDKRRCGREQDTRIVRQQLRKRKKTAICGMANLLSWQKSLDTNTLVHTCQIINRVRKRLDW